MFNYQQRKKLDRRRKGFLTEMIRNRNRLLPDPGNYKKETRLFDTGKEK